MEVDALTRDGEIKIEMQFMADVYIICEDCNGKKFKEEVLDVKCFDKNIYRNTQSIY